MTQVLSAPVKLKAQVAVSQLRQVNDDLPLDWFMFLCQKMTRYSDIQWLGHGYKYTEERANRICGNKTHVAEK